MEQAADFLDETKALGALLAPLPDTAFDEATQFKGWTVNDVIRHLHFWNRAAGLQLTDEPELVRLLGAIGAGGMRAVEREVVPQAGQVLRAAWVETAGQIAGIYATADPKARLKWAGPDMSARSSITARLMETWAHGQEVYDHLGVERIDRIASAILRILASRPSDGLIRCGAWKSLPHCRMCASQRLQVRSGRGARRARRIRSPDRRPSSARS